MNLVEVVHTVRTCGKALATALAFCEQLGRRAVT